MSSQPRPPFVVFSLPRSRSAWLSVLLSQGGLSVGHDIGVECATPEAFVQRVSLGGTCETGAAFAWPLIRRMLPGARYVMVRRDVVDVAASLHRFGFVDVIPELERRVAYMEAHADPADTLVVDFADLNDPSVCAEVFRHARGDAMDLHWWSALNRLNIQVDMPRQIERLIANQDRIATLKADVVRRLADA